jgi:hypothetical protein
VQALCSSTGNARGSTLNWRKGLAGLEERMLRKHATNPTRSPARLQITDRVRLINELNIQALLNMPLRDSHKIRTIARTVLIDPVRRTQGAPVAQQSFARPQLDRPKDGYANSFRFC